MAKRIRIVINAVIEKELTEEEIALSEKVEMKDANEAFAKNVQEFLLDCEPDAEIKVSTETTIE